MLSFTQKVINSIFPSMPLIPVSEIVQAENAGLVNLAQVGRSLNTLKKKVKVNQNSTKQVLLLDRTNVSRHIRGSISQGISKLKENFVHKSVRFSIFLDESTTCSMQTRPVYCGMMAIHQDFTWIATFTGQSDSSICKTGEDFFKLVKKIYEPYNIFLNVKKLVGAGTDGCAAMRSTPEYAGVDGRGTIGKSFISYLLQETSPSKPFAFHSVCHIVMVRR